MATQPGGWVPIGGHSKCKGSDAEIALAHAQCVREEGGGRR